MDRIHYNFEEWSSLVERYMGHLQNFPHLLPVLHNLIDGLSRKSQNLKSTRENQNRLSMTTLVEAITLCLTSQDKNFDDTGKHILEEKLSLVNAQKGVAGSKTRSGHKEGQAAGDNSAFNNSPLRAMEFYCENQRGAVQLLESKPGLKMTENGGAVKNSDSLPKRYLIESVKPDQISDPTLDFMREKK